MMIIRRRAQGARRAALCVPQCKRVGLALFAILAASGCSYFKRHLTTTELSERHQYSRDRALEELVGIAMARGYKAVNGEGQAR